MAPKACTKTKAQELQRVRGNQQRSRDRKRAYVAELEGKVRALEEKLRGCEPSTPKSGGSLDISAGNDARRELLRTLGIDEAAQQQFVEAFSKRNGARQIAEELLARKVDGMNEQMQSPPRHETEAPVSSPGGSKTGCQYNFSVYQEQSYSECLISGEDLTGSSSTRQLAPQLSFPESTGDLDVVSKKENGLTPIASDFSHPQTLQSTTSPMVDVAFLGHQASCMPCLWRGSLQASPSCPEDTTGCSIAFSMLLLNNVRGYTPADIDARLQSAYRRDGSVAEGCSVLNKALFQVLSEIS